MTGSTFGDVAPKPWDARPSCRAFLYVVTANFPHRPAPLPVSATFADQIQDRKRSRFVLSSRKAGIMFDSAQIAGHDSCFRIGIWR
jgi:hypothetical protein